MPPAPMAAMTSYGPRRTPRPRGISCSSAADCNANAPIPWELGVGVWGLHAPGGACCCAILRRVFRLKLVRFRRVTASLLTRKTASGDPGLNGYLSVVVYLGFII